MAGALAVLGACGGGGSAGGDTPVNPPPVTVSSVSVSPSTFALQVGGTVQLSAATRTASGALLTDRAVSWASANASTASVTSSGVVTAVAAGSAYVRATSEGKSDSALITVTPPPAPVATISLSPTTPNILVGDAQTLAVTVKDAAGNTLTGRTITWSSSETLRATVSSAGVVTGAGAGSTYIRATSEGKTDSVRVVVNAVPFLRKPFAGEFIASNPMDHDTPEEFVDANGYFTSSWGERIAALSSHAGYDWLMPEGTPLVATVSGTIQLVTGNFFCPPLGRNVDQTTVNLLATLPGNSRYYVRYDHMGRIDVTNGQVVTAGTPLGLSGNSGCTTAPHLHFELVRYELGRNITVDPYGWSGPGVDPWEANPRGATSFNLWVAGQAPLVSVGRDATLTGLNTAGTSPAKRAVGFLRWSFASPDENTNPNGEFVDLKIDPTVFTGATYTLTGHYIKNNAGDRYNIPAGTTLSAGGTLRIYTGSGTNTATTLYWGRSAPVYQNNGECVQLWYPDGTWYLMSTGVACR